ncbi:MAG: two-component system sensor histidine kinase CreC [Bdellovibrionales bacterium]|nr:two-component system sensor histidine kinase CreC [Bdellovibrionales bacterium]
MRNLKLSVRMALSFAVVTFLSTGIVALGAYREMRPMLLEAVELTLIDASRILASEIAEQAEKSGQLKASIKDLEKSFARLVNTSFPHRNSSDLESHRDLRVYVTDEKAEVVFDSKSGESVGKDFSNWRDINLTLKGKYGARATRQNPDDAATSIHFIAAPIIVNGKTIGAVSIGKPVDSVATQIRRNKFRVLLIFFLTLILSLPLAYIASGLIARPIQRLKKYVELRRAGMSATYPRLADDEIGSLAIAFEDLREKLEGKKYVETYVHNLTHEMKSPLTGIVGAVELLQRSQLEEKDRTHLLGNIQTEAKRLHDLAERLLELASLEARTGKLKLESFDVGLLVDEVLESFFTQARTLGVALRSEVPDGVSLFAERFLVWQCLSNLIQNSLDFSSEGSGTITISVARQDGTVKLVVRDEGVGFPDFALDRATERFFSMERPRTGKKSSGLGLSFVEQCMALHGGTVKLQNANPKGAIAELTFKARQTTNADRQVDRY